jgi:hypothetical protein
MLRIGTWFHPGTVYTLSYNLYNSPNLTEKGKVMGTITVRLRVKIDDKKRYLMEGYRPPEQRFINSQQKKTHRITRGQVKVGNMWLLLHLAVLFFSLTRVVEAPHLLPLFMLFKCEWILLANMLLQVSHPNPWHCGHSFEY